MDPNETLKTMRDESLPLDERREAAANLKDWLERGGFTPSFGYGFGGSTATRFVGIRECERVMAS